MDSKTRKLHQLVRRPNCHRCPLHETAQTVCIMGTGKTPSRFMAIAEAPGEDEDEFSGEPLTGRAGKLLDRTLADNGLSRSMFYITNAAKCRPPENRKPKPAEIAACNPFLRAELRAHKPEYVLLLGDSALRAANIGVAGLMKNRQRVVERDGVNYFIALHPAAGLHRPQYKSLFQSDIAAFARLVNHKPNNVKTRTLLVNTERHFQAYLRKLASAPVVSLDIETHGKLHPLAGEKPGTITIVGTSFEKGSAYVVPLDHVEGWAPKQWQQNAALIAKALWQSGPKKIIAHNGKFDIQWFMPFFKKPWYTFDTMLAAFLLNENRSVSLENLSLEELQVAPWKADVEYRRDFPLRKYAVYNAKDCDYTLRLYELYRAALMLHTRLAKVFARLMMPAAHIFAGIEYRGIYIPPERLQERLEEARLEEAKVVRQLLSYVPAGMRLMPRKNGKLVPFNPGSSEHMAKLLYSKEGLNIPFPAEASKKARAANKGLGSTAEGPMKLINHPITKVIERWRYLKQKVLATYFLRWKSMLDPSFHAHFSYNLIGAVTGRLSGDLHQVPRDPWVRGLLSVEDSDEWVFGAADFSQAEMRLAAELSRDKTLLHIFKTGEIDVHTNTARRVSGKPLHLVTKEDRKKAKAVNFGFLYGMFEKKFRDYARDKYEVDLSLKEARDYRQSFFDEYSGLHPWHEKQIREVKMYGEVKYLDGRVRRLPEIWSDNEMQVLEAQRQAINSPVQGVVSDMALFAMVVGERGGYGFKPLVDKDFQWMGQMHDEVIFKVRKSALDRKCRQLKRLMENLPLDQAFGFKLSVPIVSEVKFGQYWGEAEEWSDDRAA